MNALRLTILATLVATPSALRAQTFHASPADLLSVEGAERSLVFGGDTNFRAMIIEGELRGRPGIIKSIAFRTDDFNHSPSTSAARSWPNVTLDLAPSDLPQHTPTFT